MIRLSACIEMLWRDLPFEDRIARTAALGLPAFEFWSWTNKGDVQAIRHAARRHGLEVATFGVNSPTAAPYQQRPARTLVDPHNREGFLQAVRETMAIARRLEAPSVLVTTGNELDGVPRAAQHDSIVAGLSAAAPIAQEAGVTLALEPLNTLVNHPGYYLHSSAEAFDIVHEVGSPRVKVLFDAYHMQIMEGNLINTIEQHIDDIAHFHIADVPGRNEPGTGEVNWPNVLRRIAQLGYGGYVGLELRTTEPEEVALRPFLDRVAEVCQ